MASQCIRCVVLLSRTSATNVEHTNNRGTTAAEENSSKSPRHTAYHGDR